MTSRFVSHRGISELTISRLALVVGCLAITLAWNSPARCDDDDVQYQGRSLSEWRKVLVNEKAPTQDRSQAAQAIHAMGRDAKAAATDLAKIVFSEDGVAGYSAIALSGLGSDGSEAVPVLIPLLNAELRQVSQGKQSSGVRVGRAFRVLQDLGPSGTAAALALVQEKSFAELRRKLIPYLRVDRILVHQPGEIIAFYLTLDPKLNIPQFPEPDKVFRDLTREDKTRIQDAVSEHLPGVLKAFAQAAQNRDVQEKWRDQHFVNLAAAIAFAGLHRPGASEALAKELVAGNRLVVEQLLLLGEPTDEAYPLLVKAAEDKDQDVQQAARRVLQKHFPKGPNGNLARATKEAPHSDGVPQMQEDARPATYKLLETVGKYPTIHGIDKAATGDAFSADERWAVVPLVTPDEEQNAFYHLYDLQKQVFYSLEGGSKYASKHFFFSPNSRFLLGDGAVLWSLTPDGPSSEARFVHSEPGLTNAAIISHDSSRIAIGMRSSRELIKTIIVLDIETLDEVASIELFDTHILGLVFSLDDRLLAVQVVDGPTDAEKTIILDASTLKEQQDIPKSAGKEPKEPQFLPHNRYGLNKGNYFDFEKLAKSPMIDRFVITSFVGGRPFAFKPHTTGEYGVNGVEFVDLYTGKEMSIFADGRQEAGFKADTVSLAISQRGDCAFGCVDGWIRFLDLRRQHEVGSFQAHPAPVDWLAISPKGRYLLSFGRERMLNIWGPGE